MSSLEKFLESVPDLRSEGGGFSTEDDLDEAIWKKDSNFFYEGNSLGHWSALSVVKVFVYEMPNKFTYDLLKLFLTTYKETENLTSNGSPVHRLIEQVTSI